MKKVVISLLVLIFNLPLVLTIQANEYVTPTGTIQMVYVGDGDWVNIRIIGADVINPFSCPKQSYYGIDPSQAHYKQLFAALLTARITGANVRLTIHPNECSGQWGSYPKITKVELEQ